jgi:hypothetical protein
VTTNFGLISASVGDGHFDNKSQSVLSNPNSLTTVVPSVGVPAYRYSPKVLIKNGHLARHWWFTPVILVTSGGRDQEGHSLKPAQAYNSLQDRIS